MFIAYTCVFQHNTSFTVPMSVPVFPVFARALRDSNSPADLAHVEELVSRPSPAPRCVARTLPSIFRRVRSSSHIARCLSHLSSSSSWSSVCEKGAVSDALRVVSKRAFAPSGCIDVEVQLGRCVYRPGSPGNATARVRWVAGRWCRAIMGGFGSGLRSRDDFQSGCMWVVVSCRELC